ncbi:MAG: TonB-dependent receptor [Bacteroidia bacterium]|nr:TonB-dependent receptor [Bacteroidia bacterium]
MRRSLKTAVLAAAFLMFEGMASAQQQYTYQVNVSDQTVNVAGLDLPGSTPLSDILALVPELLKNADQTVSSGQYDILVEGISVDCAANSVLSHLHLSDVKSISISDSPTASQQRNGSGGVINITLASVPDGWSGRASINASSAANFHESAMLNFHKGKLTVRSWLMVDTSVPDFKNEFRTLDTDHGTIYRVDTVRTRSNYQMGRVFADFNPSARDSFKFRFWESSQKSGKLNYMEMIPTGESDAGGNSESQATTVSATLAYTHSFPAGSSFSAEIDYAYQPEFGMDGRRNTLYPDGEPTRKVETLTKGHNWTGSLSFGTPVIKSGEKVILDFKTGFNMTAKSFMNDYSEKVNFASELMVPSSLDGNVIISMSDRSLYVSPYIELGGGWSEFKYKASVRYQNYRSSMDTDGGEKMTSFQNDITANLSIGWQMDEHNLLRFVFDRGIIRPSNWQMYPMLVYRPDKAGNIIGNPDLVSSKLNSANINYVTDFKKNNSTYVINGSIGLIYADGLINSIHGVTNAGSLLPYTSYINEGSSHILKADLMFSYKNGPLMLTFASNFYDKLLNVNENKDYRMYYNGSFSSTYRVSPDWTIFGELVYNSPIMMPTISYNSYINGNLRISRIWTKLEAYAAVTDILHKARREVTKSGLMTSYRYYDLNASSVVIGFSYKF